MVADAVLYQRENEAKAMKAAAEAQLFSKKMAADGEFYAKKKEAEGLVASGQAQGAYLHQLHEASGGKYEAVRDFMMINIGGMYPEMARINAAAVNGLQPKISIWTNGGEGGAGSGNTAVNGIAGVYKTLAPLFDTVHEQTGMQPPSWMGTLSASNSQA